MIDTPTLAAVFALVLGAILLYRIGWLRLDVVAGLALVLLAAYAVGISPPGNLPGLLSARIADAVGFSLSTPGLALLAAFAVGFIALRRSAKPVRWDIVLGLLAVLLTVYAVWSSAPNLGGLSTIFSANPWLFATLLILLLFRQTVREVVAALAKRLEAGSVDLNIGQVVKIKIEEPSITDAAPSALPFSRSPFEIEGESVVDESRIRFDLLPQILLSITDIVADLWSNQQANKPRRATLDKARDGLKDSHGQGSVRISLVKFVVAIRRCRFLKCNDLLRLREASRELDTVLADIEKKPVSGLSVGERLILHCLGIANALDEHWSFARDLLIPLIDDLKYLPAADTYLACKFNAYIKEKTSGDTDLDAKEFLTWFSNTWVTEAKRLLDDCDKADWTKLFRLNNKGFHMRELYKVLGGIHSIVAENFSKQEFYVAADKYLAKCTLRIENEDASALDHNNLADLYRKMGRYEERYLREAHDELDKAFQLSGKTPDPAFYYTRAEIFRAQGSRWEGVEALNGYTEARARKDDEIRGYIANQIFAAKLVAEDSSFGRWKLALSIDILERAKAFLEREKARVQTPQRRSLECELNELIGIAYLELPHCEEKSISALEDSLRVCADPLSEAQWKRTVALARAHVRHARSLRQRTSILEAARHRREAERWLEDSDSKLSAFPVDHVSPGRAARRFRLHCDALIANQELAEEVFQQGALEAAKARLDGTVAKLLGELGGFLEKDQAREALAAGLAEMRAQLAHYRAYREFLLGRILARVAPDLVAEVRAAFGRSRNVEGMLTPWVDVELGTFLLSAAAKNKEDMTIYDEAIASLESAASADQLAPRREAVRVLTLAYARRPQLRKQK